MSAAYIAVVGPSAAGHELREQAREAAALLALSGAAVIVGGLDGVSRAAAEGASAAHGTVLAFGTGLARSGVDLAAQTVIPTGLGELSNGLVVRSADALLCIGGGWGTLMEVALALRTEVPVVSLNGWSVHDAAGIPVAGPEVASQVPEAVRLVLAAARRRRAEDGGRIG